MNLDAIVILNFELPPALPVKLSYLLYISLPLDRALFGCRSIGQGWLLYKVENKGLRVRNRDDFKYKRKGKILAKRLYTVTIAVYRNRTFGYLQYQLSNLILY